MHACAALSDCAALSRAFSHGPTTNGMGDPQPFYSMPYGLSRASFHVPSGCLLAMSVAVPAQTLTSPDDETVSVVNSTTTSTRSSPAEMILRTSNFRSGLYENLARNISRNSAAPR